MAPLSLEKIYCMANKVELELLRQSIKNKARELK